MVRMRRRHGSRCRSQIRLRNAASARLSSQSVRALLGIVAALWFGVFFAFLLPQENWEELKTTTVVLLAGLATLPFTDWVPVQRQHIAIFAASGALIAVAHTLMIESFRRGEAALVAPFKYSALLWATLIGFIVFGELPDRWTVVGAVLIRGGRAPHVVSEAMVKDMQAGSVIVDVSVDQGGCIATSHPTTHSEPVFRLHGVTHYCVANMPGAYPRTSTLALTGATLPYIKKLATDGIDALRADAGFMRGLNTYQGHITCQAVAGALGLDARYRAFAELV